MLQGRVIVCVASSWDYDPTGKHHLMRILSRDNEVVWINYHGTRRPKMTRGDLRAGCSTLVRILRGARRVNRSMIHTTPLVIPGAASPPLRGLNERMLIRQIRQAVRSVDPSGSKPLQVWSFAPDVPYLVGRFDEECFLYYCVDEHSQFEGVDADRIAASEAELVRRADLVITSSKPLFDSKRRIRPDVVLLRHGVDYDHFAAAWRRELPCPREIVSVPKPVFGFFGVIHHWIDVELMAAVAEMRPQYSFVLIGEQLVDVSVLSSLPNVHLLGRRPNAELPAYCAAFSAGLMPFRQTEMTQNINPIKMYEYLAAGLPVISTPLPETRRYDGPIITADTPERFAAGCDRVLASDHPGRREAISSVVRNESWLSKVEHLSTIVEDRILSNERPCDVSEPSRRNCAGVL